MSAPYKATALKAAKTLPAWAKLKVSQKFVADQMAAAHPEISWGVLGSSKTTGKWEKKTCMSCSLDPSQVLTLFIGDHLSFSILALKSKADEAFFEQLGGVQQRRTKLKKELAAVKAAND